MTEAKLTKNCVDLIRKRGWFAKKIHGGPHQPAGLADINACIRGHYVAIEMKMPGKENTLTERQAKALREVKESGGIAVVCTSERQVERLCEKIEAKYA